MRDHQCFNLDSEGRVERLSAENLSCMEKGKAKIGEEISEDDDQYQLEGYLPAYLKMVEDEVDEPETTIEELEEVSLDECNPEKKLLVSTLLTKEENDQLMVFLCKNKDIFAWSHRDIPGIDPSMAEHQLNIDKRYLPVWQKKRRFALERNKIISDEIDRLLETDAIEPYHYPNWLSNLVVVKKKNGKWRVCIDFTNCRG